MINRIFVLVLAWPAVTGPLSAGGQPSQAEGARRGSEAVAPADSTTSRPELSADEAIRVAIDAIDQLESTVEEEARRALLDKVRGSIEVVEGSSPGNPWLYYLHGRVSALTGSGIDAAELLQRFVETRAGRNEWRAHRVLGDLFVGLYPRLARASYETAARLNRDDPSVQIGLSKCAFAVGDVDEAVGFARKAVGADEDPEIRYVRHLASMLMAQRSWPEAQRIAERGLAAAQASAQALGQARVSLEILGEQYRLLIEILQRRAKVTPGNAQVYLDVSKHLRLQADNVAMLSRYDVLGVLQLGVDSTAPGTPVVLLEQYAIALAAVGRREDAVAQFELILGRDANNSVAAEWLARLKAEVPAPNPEP